MSLMSASTGSSHRVGNYSPRQNSFSGRNYFDDENLLPDDQTDRTSINESLPPTRGVHHVSQETGLAKVINRPRPRPTRTTPEPTQNEPTPAQPSRLNFSRNVPVTSGNVRLVIALDYGTTFTGVATAVAKSDVAQLSDVTVMQNWGDRQTNPILNQWKIPSVKSYTLARGEEEQWGNDISENAITMVNTKLELELQDKKIDELSLVLKVLEGTGDLSFENVKRSGAYPAYTWKSPSEIVTDYLKHVCQCVVDDIGPAIATTASIDFVATIPVGWSYEATNLTFRALTQAGFNKETFPTLKDMILVTEPEAASHFTARHMREILGRKFLRQGEVFVLTDAGGGTVDSVAYQVNKLSPQLELEAVSMPTSDKCGATYVDANFKRWLRKLIGIDKYRKLDPNEPSQRISTHSTENSLMREVMQIFEAQKKRFSNSSPEFIELDLAAQLGDLTIEGRIDSGLLRIYSDEMKKYIFNPCVNRVVELIDGQIQQVESRRNKEVKNVFLVGGFGESPYLQEELKAALKIRRIAMPRPATRDESWTAVVRGAAIYGIEKAHQSKLRTMASATRSFGIVVDKAFSRAESDPRDLYTNTLANVPMARGQFAWMIRRGDLVLSDEKRVAQRDFPFFFRASDVRVFTIGVWTYPEDDDDEPERWETGQHDVVQVGIVHCDISMFSNNQFEAHFNYDTKEAYYIAYLVCRMQLSLQFLKVEVLVNESKVGSTEIVLADINIAAQNSPGPESSEDEDDFYD